MIPIYLVCYQVLNYFFGFYDLSQAVSFGMWSQNATFNTTLSACLASLFVLFNAYGLNLLVNRNNFYERNTYLVALIYIVFMSLFQYSYLLNGTLLLHAAVIIMIHQMFELSKREDGRKNIFNAFLFLGIGVTVFPLFVFMLPMIVLSVLVIRAFSLQEALTALTGFLLPFIYYFSFEYLSNTSFGFQLNPELLNNEDKDFWFVAISIAIFLILSFVVVIVKSRKAKIQTNKQIRSLIILIVTFLLMSLYQIISFQQINPLSLVLIPMSILLIFAFLSDTYAMAANVLFYIVFTYSVIKFFLFLPTQDV